MVFLKLLLPNTITCCLFFAFCIISPYSYFTRGTIQEHLVFAARTTVARCDLGSRTTISLNEAPVLLHVYVRHDGLTGIVVSDLDYPARVAFALIAKSLQTFEQRVGEKWTRVQADQALAPQFLIDDLQTYQDPKADKLQAVQVCFSPILSYFG